VNEEEALSQAAHNGHVGVAQCIVQHCAALRVTAHREAVRVQQAAAMAAEASRRSRRLHREHHDAAPLPAPGHPNSALVLSADVAVDEMGAAGDAVVSMSMGSPAASLPYALPDEERVSSGFHTPLSTEHRWPDVAMASEVATALAQLAEEQRQRELRGDAVCGSGGDMAVDSLPTRTSGGGVFHDSDAHNVPMCGSVGLTGSDGGCGGSGGGCAEAGCSSALLGPSAAPSAGGSGGLSGGARHGLLQGCDSVVGVGGGGTSPSAAAGALLATSTPAAVAAGTSAGGTSAGATVPLGVGGVGQGLPPLSSAGGRGEGSAPTAAAVVPSPAAASKPSFAYASSWGLPAPVDSHGPPTGTTTGGLSTPGSGIAATCSAGAGGGGGGGGGGRASGGSKGLQGVRASAVDNAEGGGDEGVHGVGRRGAVVWPHSKLPGLAALLAACPNCPNRSLPPSAGGPNGPLLPHPGCPSPLQLWCAARDELSGCPPGTGNPQQGTAGRQQQQREWGGCAAFHWYSLFCDGCGALPVRGRRWRCRDCPRYFLQGLPALQGYDLVSEHTRQSALARLCSSWHRVVHFLPTSPAKRL
jgi:hypothetical protein